MSLRELNPPPRCFPLDTSTSSRHQNYRVGTSELIGWCSPQTVPKKWERWYYVRRVTFLSKQSICNILWIDNFSSFVLWYINHGIIRVFMTQGSATHLLLPKRCANKQTVTYCGEFQFYCKLSWQKTNIYYLGALFHEKKTCIAYSGEIQQKSNWILEFTRT